ncbi:MAG: toll/interleukin-1 receptor domain-containing protein [Planctomycetes bacterium]|nr:toll/interleukin-1 receptor domain-containing protein [Planctomycetota bacterium]
MKMRYWAFLSYSSQDGAACRRLQRAIERYRIPRRLVGTPGRAGPVPRRVFPVFRDRDELPLSADIGSSVRDALRASRCLIVLGSPRSATSRWVNEEVRSFKALGRQDRVLAVILDGEPNASDVVGREHLECFAPALRHEVDAEGRIVAARAEPIAGDLRRGGDGFRRTVLKAVAGSVGLGLDELVRRDVRRRRARAALLGVLALGLIAAGWLRWDFTRTKTGIYAVTVDRWGVPQGLRRISEGDAEHLDRSYVVETREGLVRRVSCRSRSGALVEDPELRGVTTQVIVYDEHSQPIRIDGLSRWGACILRCKLGSLRREGGKARRRIEFLHGLNDLPLTPERDAKRTERSDITSQEITYDDAGRIEERMFTNAYGRPRHDERGVVLERWQYEAGLGPSRIEYLLPDGSASTDNVGIASVEFERDAMGRVTRERLRGPQGELRIGTRGWAERQTAWGQDDCQESLFDAAGAPTMGVDGWHRRTREVRGGGLHVRTGHFLASGDPAYCLDGWHCQVDEFDASGELVVRSYVDGAGQPSTDKRGVYRIEFVRSGEGARVREAHFAIKGPALDTHGRHAVERVVDVNGNVLQERSFNEADEPTVNNQGWHQIISEYGPLGVRSTEAYFGVDLLPTVSVHGVHRAVNVVDERGSIVEQATFDARGAPCVGRIGAHRLVRQLDSHGRVIENRLFDIESRPTRGVGGWHHAVTRYDEAGNVTEELMFDEADSPVRGDFGWHRRVRAYDGWGREVESRHFGVNGEALQGPSGAHHVRTIRDAWGRTLDERLFDAAGSPTVGRFGWHRVEFTYDDRGNNIEERLYGPSGEPVADVRGWHRSVRRFDEQNRVLGWKLFGTDEKPATVPNGYHEWRNTYNAVGRDVLWAVYGTDGAPAVHTSGWHRHERVFDQLGRIVAERAWGVRGEPVAGAEGAHHLTYVYDASGRVSVERMFGPGGVPVVGFDGWHRRVHAYDRFGHELEPEDHDLQGRRLPR